MKFFIIMILLMILSSHCENTIEYLYCSNENECHISFLYYIQSKLPSIIYREKFIGDSNNDNHVTQGFGYFYIEGKTKFKIYPLYKIKGSDVHTEERYIKTTIFNEWADNSKFLFQKKPFPDNQENDNQNEKTKNNNNFIQLKGTFNVYLYISSCFKCIEYFHQIINTFPNIRINLLYSEVYSQLNFDFYHKNNNNDYKNSFLLSNIKDIEIEVEKLVIIKKEKNEKKKIIQKDDENAIININHQKNFLKKKDERNSPPKKIIPEAPKNLHKNNNFIKSTTAVEENEKQDDVKKEEGGKEIELNTNDKNKENNKQKDKSKEAEEIENYRKETLKKLINERLRLQYASIMKNEFGEFSKKVRFSQIFELTQKEKEELEQLKQILMLKKN